MSENPAMNEGVVPNVAARKGGTEVNHVGPSGMGTEGGSIGVITALNVDGESFPVITRTVNEPEGEFLK